MNRYHVTYYYLATGMEGYPDMRDYGEVHANSAQEAINKIGRQVSSSDNEWERNFGLSAELLT